MNHTFTQNTLQSWKILEAFFEWTYECCKWKSFLIKAGWFTQSNAHTRLETLSANNKETRFKKNNFETRLPVVSVIEFQIGLNYEMANDQDSQNISDFMMKSYSFYPKFWFSKFKNWPLVLKKVSLLRFVSLYVSHKPFAFKEVIFL